MDIDTHVLRHIIFNSSLYVEDELLMGKVKGTLGHTLLLAAQVWFGLQHATGSAISRFQGCSYSK